MTNIAILTGRIARDPDTRETKGGTNVTGITVVTDRPARDKDGRVPLFCLPSAALRSDKIVTPTAAIAVAFWGDP